MVQVSLLSNPSKEMVKWKDMILNLFIQYHKK